MKDIKEVRQRVQNLEERKGETGIEVLTSLNFEDPDEMQAYSEGDHVLYVVIVGTTKDGRIYHQYRTRRVYPGKGETGTGKHEKGIRIEQLQTFEDFFRNKASRVNALYGGAGSGKSVGIAQELCLRFITERDIKIFVTRKTFPALRVTAWQLIRDILMRWGIPVAVNLSDRTITYRTNVFQFGSVDDPERWKSFEANFIWMEEATDFTYHDYMQIKLRLRRKTPGITNQMYMTFNPISSYHWLFEKVITPLPKGVSVHHSTHLDNPFLDKEYRAELLRLSEEDENYHRIYTLGLPGELRGIIFSNYTVVPTFPTTGVKQRVFGLDFGFNNPSALIEVGARDDGLYLKELLYATHLTTGDLIEKLKDLVPKDGSVYADSAEPDRIEEIRRAGFTIYPAEKSVKTGIDRVKRFKLFIDAESTNLIGEIRGYKWREDAGGHSMEEPVKFRDHLMDALRYAVMPVWEQKFGRTSRGIPIPPEMCSFGYGGFHFPGDIPLSARGLTEDDDEELGWLL